MKVKAFEEGQRVACVRRFGGVAEGMTGTVCDTSYSESIGVWWDDDIHGHNCNGKCPHGYGYYISHNDIKRIDDDLAIESEDVMSLISM